MQSVTRAYRSARCAFFLPVVDSLASYATRMWELNDLTFVLACITAFSLVAAMISYNVCVGDTLSKVLIRFLPTSWDISMGTVRFIVVFVVTVCIVVPLCLYKDVSRLARASFISLACVVFILFAVILKFISGDYDVV